MILIPALLLTFYCLTMLQLIYGFRKIKAPHQIERKPQTFFSIVVPFRNERQNLPTLLESIKNLNYPIDLFEIILIDDFSEDDSAKLVYNWRMQNGGFQFTLLENVSVTDSPKKDAITRAVHIA